MWMKTNVFSLNLSLINNIPRDTIFVYLIWYIWHARNIKVFESTMFHAGYVIYIAKFQAYEWFYLASGTNASKTSNSSYFIGWWKLNSNESYLSDSHGFGPISTGGVIRNSQRIWVKGYVWLNYGLYIWV